MSKIMNLKRKVQQEVENLILDELLKRLEKADELKEQGKDAEGNMVMNDMREWLNHVVQDMEKKSALDEEAIVERSTLTQEGEVVAVGNKVRLGVIKKDEKEKYLSILYEYSTMKNYYKDERLREETWQDFLLIVLLCVAYMIKIQMSMLGIVQ